MKKTSITLLIVLMNTILVFSQPLLVESNYLLPHNESTINSNKDFKPKDDSISKKVKQFEIKKANNVNFVIIKKNISSPSNVVEIKLVVDKSKEYYNTIELSSNSGYQVLSPGYIAFKDVVYPFSAQIKFHVTGQFIITKFIDVEFIITEEGGWTVEIVEELINSSGKQNRLSSI